MVGWQDESVADRVSPSVRTRLLGRRLRQYREDSGLDLVEASKVLGVGPSYLSKMETGDRKITKPVLLLAFHHFGISDDARNELETLRAQAESRTWYQEMSVPLGTYVDFEQEAIQVRSFDPIVVPGLLQTRDYAAAVIGIREDVSTDQRKTWLEVRVRRAELLNEEPRPTVRAIIHETALMTIVGSRQTMVDQIRHVADTGESVPNVDVQVLPCRHGAYPSMEGAFNILDFQELPTLGFIESILSGRLIERQRDINTLQGVFGKLIAEAMPARDSIAWLRRYADKLELDKDEVEEEQPKRQQR